MYVLKRPDRQIRVRSTTGNAAVLPADMNPVVRRVLLGRGISCETELSLGLRDMQGPAELIGIEQAADLLAEAVCSDR